MSGPANELQLAAGQGTQRGAASAFGRPVRAGAQWCARHPLAAAFLLGVAAMWWIQSASYEPSGRDSFYHIKMAVLLPQIGFPDSFPWLHHTILYDKNVSHHTGFHVMLMPFVYASKWTADLLPQGIVEWAQKGSDHLPLRLIKYNIAAWHAQPYILGGKILNVLLFGVATMLVMLILRTLKVGMRWFWLCAFLALPWEFYLRMSYIRAPIASLVLMLLICYCCLTRRWKWLAVLGALAAHIYLGALVFYPLVIGAFVVAEMARRQPARTYMPLVGAAAIGTLLGLVTHPFFPDSVAFLKVQLLKTGLQIEDVNKVSVGIEWKSYDQTKFLQISAFVLLLFGASVLFRANWKRLFEPGVIAFLILNLFFLGLCLRHRRFIEYWPVFALLSAATLWIGFDEERHAFVTLVSRESERTGIFINSFIKKLYVGILLVVIALSGMSLSQARRVARSGFDHSSIKEAMAFLSKNSPPGSLVLADDWDTFPLLFYYNHWNHYVCGLDPQFSNTKDPELWERYCVITQGRAPRTSQVMVRADGAASPEYVEKEFRVRLGDISEHFDADYVVVDKDHTRFYRHLLSKTQQFKLIYPPAPRKPAKQPPLAIFEVLKQSDTGEPK